MSQINNISIAKEIEVDKSHIDNFVLESDKGTKKLRAKFRKNAIIERNSYIEKQKKLFNYYSRKIYFELDGRIGRIFPVDNEKMFTEMENTINKYEQLVIESNKNLSVSTKLGLEVLISSISETISLVELNNKLTEFIEKFSCAGIQLNVDDFGFSMFTRDYMSMYFSNVADANFASIASDIFEKLYFECPKLITHIKMALHHIIKKYEPMLVKYLEMIVSKKLESEDISNDKVIGLYLDSKTELMWAMEKDPYRNLDIFLNKQELIADYIPEAFTREKKFSTFAKGESYKELSDEDKSKYNVVIKDFFGVLKELKEYYRYEFILKDLIKRYENRANSKALYEAKLKEVNIVEKNREKILKEYSNSGKSLLFGFKAKDVTKVSKLHMNEELVKLESLMDELNDLEFNYKLSVTLDDAASIHDLFTSSLLSFSYIEKSFNETFSEDEDYSLEKEFNRYIGFLFSSFNNFLRKVNGLVDYDIPLILADKYMIQGLNVKVSDVSKENIDVTRVVLDFIIRALCVDENNLNSTKMNYICKVKAIQPLEGWEIVDEEII